jgi:methyl-accepting chemotaxis protein/ligand-binding sensor domain-containing protein
MIYFNRLILKIVLVGHFILLISYNFTYSQATSSVFERVTVKDGLSQSTINHIIQDRYGFLWFATYGGLSKYDGYSFTIYQNDENDSTSLSNNGIQNMFEDSAGYIWVMNNGSGGLDRFDPRTEKFARYTYNPADGKSLSSNEINYVMQDKLGNIWICANNAINLFVEKKDGDKILTQFKRLYNKTNIPFTYIYENRNNQLLLFADYLYFLDRKTETFHKTNTELANTKIISVAEDKFGNLFLGTSEKGLIKLTYNNQNSTYEKVNIDKINITPNNRNTAIFDNYGRLWIGTESKGLYCYDEAKDLLINYMPDKLDDKSLSDNTTPSLFIDFSGILWIGTFSQGLCKYDLYKKEFIHFKSMPSQINSLSGNSVNQITSINPKELWVGLDLGGGVNRFIFNEKNEPNIIRYLNNPNDNNTIASNSTLSLVQRKNGDVWIGSAGGTISRITPEKPGSNGKPIIKRYKQEKWTFAIYEDSDGVLWGGTWGRGLWRFDDKTEEFTSFMPIPNDSSSICDDVIWAIGEDSYKNIWIGGHSKGLSILPAQEKNKTNPKFINFKKKKGNSLSLSDNTINAFCLDHKGVMWIGTMKGFDKVVDKDNTLKNLNNNSKLEFVSYHKKDGLPGESIIGIVEDKSGNLWMSTSYGISKFNGKDTTFTNYTDNDGLQSNEFDHNSYFINSDGRIFFGGPNGLNAFYPDNIKSSTILPKVVLTDLKILNKSVKPGQEINGEVILSKPIHMTSSITLSHKNNIITFEFAAIHYTRPSNNKYAYYLEGFDNDWNYSGNKRTATYTNLNPGKYTFRVKASNNDGVWNEEGTSIEIEILPPWWGTIWFRVIAILLIVSLIVTFISWRTRQLKQNQKLLENKVKEATDKVNSQNSKLIEAQGKLTGIMDDVRNQLGRASEELLDASNSQASSAEEISASMEEIASEITENASSMLQMLEIIKHVEGEAEESVEIVSNTLNSINDISESIKFVSEFARMTNLLSLNAAIEAARAGVHGRSFAVVATQVKKLADQSAEVAVKIQKSSADGQKLSQEANDKIIQLNEIIKGIVNTITEINQSIQNQSVEANNINNSILQMSMYISNTSELAGQLDAAINSLTIND